MKKIYITGCARSGTTLLARLFYGFDRCQIINDECSLLDFTTLDTSDFDADFIVGKRTEKTIFSNTLASGNIEKHLNLLDNILVINCIRDGRHVVESWVKAWGMYDPFAWMNSILQAEQYAEYIVLTIKYEDLISNPDLVQRKISEATGIEIKYPFSAYPEFVPEYAFPTENEKYTLTKIENRNPDSAPYSYLQKPNDTDTFIELLKKLNYVRD